MTIDELAASTGGTILSGSDRPIRGGAVDSREVRPGNVFVALPGERTDGHAFLGDAVAAGASALVVTRPPVDRDALAGVGMVRVEDGVAALGAIAAAWRRRFEPLTIGITGSIAKTSTKEAVATVLARRLRTLRSAGNRNNEIGLPLTVLDLDASVEALVLEMGMYVGGEIADLARIGRPSVGIVTAIQGVHLSRIGTLDAIEAAKGELVEALPPTGTAILNRDDERVMRLARRTSAAITTYGFDPSADVAAESVESAGVDGMRFVLRFDGERVDVRTPGLGRMAVHNALAAAAAGRVAGLPPEAIVEGLALGWSIPNRAGLVRAGRVTIVDDSYNASPGSVAAALDLLAGLPGRRIAVLGEMLELGDAAEAGHRGVGAIAAGIVDRLVVVGQGAEGIARGALDAGLPGAAVERVADAAAARSLLARSLRSGDVVLVKASRGAALDVLVEGLVADLGRDRVDR